MSSTLSFNAHVAAATKIAHERRAHSQRRAMNLELSQDERDSEMAAARDLSISITALEDALTRYNSARYRQQGVWKRADPDEPQNDQSPAT